MTVDKVNNLLPVMWQCDTAWLSYKGLRNPNNQGRDFLHTVGSVPNPGYQNPNGWMPEVSHFAVSLVPAPFDGTSTRNSVWASFVPIAWDPAVQVIMGTTLNVSQIPAGPSPTVGGGSTPTVGGTDPTVNGGTANGAVAAPSGGGTTIGSGGDGTGGAQQIYGGSSNSGGCSVGSAGAGGATENIGQAALGLGLAAAASRRRRAAR
jgi:MYXO-CTERM domain-containing protein